MWETQMKNVTEKLLLNEHETNKRKIWKTKLKQNIFDLIRS